MNLFRCYIVSLLNCGFIHLAWKTSQQCSMLVSICMCDFDMYLVEKLASIDFICVMQSMPNKFAVRRRLFSYSNCFTSTGSSQTVII